MGKPSAQGVLMFSAGRAGGDLTDDETSDEVMDTDEAVELERRALEVKRQAISRDCSDDCPLPSDTKAKRLRGDHRRAAKARPQAGDRVHAVHRHAGLTCATCWSPRGATFCASLAAAANTSTQAGTGAQSPETRRSAGFRDGEADILLCTDAAAEG